MRRSRFGGPCGVFGLALMACLAGCAWSAEPVPAISASAFLVRDAKVTVQVEVEVLEASLTTAEREALATSLRTALAMAVKDAGLTVVDAKQNAADRKAAEARAVLKEAAPEKVAEAVRPYLLDGMLRLNVTISAPFWIPDDKSWRAKWRMTANMVDVRNPAKAKKSWVLPADARDALSCIGKGETAEKACRAAAERIASRFAQSLKEKLAVSTVPAAH